jgi:putative ABC transport system permease protein
MRILHRLRSRLLALVHADVREREMDEELRFHLDLEAGENRRRGLAPEDARRAAVLSFGSVESVREACRDARGVRMLHDLAQDAAFALRGLRRDRAFAATVVLTLGLGIGANTAMFSVVDTVLLRPLPYRSGENLMILRQSAAGAGIADLGLSPLEVQDFRSQAASSLSAVVEYHSMNFTLLGGSEARRVRTGVVSWNFFDVFGVKPVLGRAFRAEDETPGADAVLLLSHEFWKDEMGGDPGVVGRHFEMNDRVHTVVGVLPPLPRYPDANDVYMPTTACPFRSAASVSENRRARMVQAFARIRDGVPLGRARAAVAAVADRMRKEYKDAYAQAPGYRADLLPLREELVRRARPTFLLLLATVAGVLLIACANVSNLMVARLAGREKELAVRAALGAGRGRLLRQLLTESTILALAGGVLGLLFAVSVSGTLTSFVARFTPRASELRIDGGVLAFTLVVAVLTGLLSGSLPGLPAWRRLAEALGEGGRSGAGGGHRLRAALVVSQLAVSFVLLIGAALTLRSFVNLLNVDAGFRSENVLTASVDLNWSRYRTPERQLDRPRVLAFHHSLEERLRAQPGVVEVGQAWTFPLNARFNNDGTFQVEGRPVEAGQALPRAEARGASAGYFRAIGVPVLRGRDFDERDDGESGSVVLVSQGLAQRQFGDSDPVGRRLSLNGGRTWSTIVGVVGDVRNAALDEEPRDTIYLPFLQYPGFGSQVFVRTLGDPMAVARALQSAVRALDPQTALHDVRTLEDVRDASVGSNRLTAVLLGGFALLALVITAAGLSGLLAYSVSRRTHEIGVRVALGATRSSVLLMVLGQGMRSVALGLALGALGALALARLLSGLLFGVAPTDLLCFVGSAAVLAAVATLACVVPARRATTIDPQLALRSL